MKTQPIRLPNICYDSQYMRTRTQIVPDAPAPVPVLDARPGPAPDAPALVPVSDAPVPVPVSHASLDINANKMS